MTFRIAFLNCKNLYPVGHHITRSPLAQDELDTRIEQLAATLQGLFGDMPAEVVALCEIGTEAVGRRLANALRPNFYEVLWSGLPIREDGRGETGLMLLYSPLAVRINPVAKKSDSNPETTGQRARWMAVNLFVQRFGAVIPFWLVLNHWKSAHGHGPDGTEAERMRSADEVGKLRLELNQDSLYREQPMILIGDFNCEPFDRALTGSPKQDLRCVRERRLIFRPRNRKAYFYNPSWRWLHQFTKATGVEADLPSGTICLDSEWKVFDQIMVTKEVLEEGGSLRFIESSLTMRVPEAGCSDHCAIGAVFEIVE